MENAFSLEDIRPSILKIKIKGKLLPVMLTAGFKTIGKLQVRYEGF